MTTDKDPAFPKASLRQAVREGFPKEVSVKLNAEGGQEPALARPVWCLGTSWSYLCFAHPHVLSVVNVWHAGGDQSGILSL